MSGNALNRMLWHATIAVLLALAVVFARCAWAAAEDSALSAPASNASDVARATVQPPGAGGVDTTTLVRALAAEAWGSDADYAPILAVLARRAERVGLTPAKVAKRYVSALRTGRTRRRWVLHLDADCAEPAHWPAKLAWSAHRSTCTRIVKVVRRFERGERSACKASHWGGPKLASDMARAKHMPVVDCGATANRFFGEPARGAVDAREASGK